jgi:mannitol/fructose-specific phosphotransferase system IIA component
MAIITADLVRLNAQATDKEDAIKQAGALLIENGRVTAGYVDGMLTREQTMSTYLGNGIAIPHGMFDSRTDILQTGISVVQFPAGIEWEDGELAYLVIGIAATADEHIGVLANLSQVIEEEADAQQLIQTGDPMLIVERLGRPAAVEEED